LEDVKNDNENKIGKERQSAMLLLGAAACMLGCSNDPKTDKSTDEGTDSTSDGNENDGGDGTDNPATCLPNWNPDTPAFRLTAMSPTAPASLASVASASQAAVDSGDLNYLLTMDVTDTNATAELGLGEAAGDENTYSFAGDRTSVTLEISGDEFSSTELFEFPLVVPLAAADTSILVPMKEVSINGTFASADRCAIGSETADGWEPGGEISGLVTIDDAKAAVITVDIGGSSRTFTLCAFMAYGTAGVIADPDCATDPSDWTYAADQTTAALDPAWRVNADIAAAAVTFLE
jgi:hypothetical protein